MSARSGLVRKKLPAPFEAFQANFSKDRANAKTIVLFLLISFVGQQAAIVAVHPWWPNKYF